MSNLNWFTSVVGLIRPQTMWKLITGVIIIKADFSERSYDKSETLHAIDGILAKVYQK